MIAAFAQAPVTAPAVTTVTPTTRAVTTVLPTTPAALLVPAINLLSAKTVSPTTQAVIVVSYRRLSGASYFLELRGTFWSFAALSGGVDHVTSEGRARIKASQNTNTATCLVIGVLFFDPSSLTLLSTSILVLQSTYARWQKRGVG